ncbi:6296_t:CDS:2, partial [Acaulospora morrowiae]
MDRKRKNNEFEIHGSLKAQKTSTNGRLVKEHYNKKEDVGVERRKDSNILFLKNFNNWIKSVLIGKHRLQGGTVLDIGCGKGGDLLKWSKAKISRLVGADIADVSIKDAQTRWESMKGHRFDAEFHVLDCFSNRLSTINSIKDIEFDAVSMQFCLHYSFETEEKARMG